VEQRKKQPSPVVGSTRKPGETSDRAEQQDTDGIGPMPRIVQVGDVAYAQNKNNTRIIAAHYYGGLRESTGEVSLSYYGMSAFKITSPKGLELFIDPWKNPCDPSWGGIWYRMRMPMTHCDIGLITHSHFDHNAFEMLDAGMTIKKLGGVYTFADVKITGFVDKHIVETESPVYTAEVLRKLYPFPDTDPEDWDNSILMIETGGLRIVHWGDNRQNPPQDVWDRLQDIDVVLLPVTDDGRMLTPEWADRIAAKMNAKIIIPSHYYFEGINIPGAGWGKTSIEYTKSHEHTILDSHTVQLSPEKLKDRSMHVMYFGENVPFPIEKLELPENSEVRAVPEIRPVWEQYGDGI
jgi:L-ascorbate metabolism protein UlaG (beta-lactamase superfamily)